MKSNHKKNGKKLFFAENMFWKLMLGNVRNDVCTVNKRISYCKTIYLYIHKPWAWPQSNDRNKTTNNIVAAANNHSPLYQPASSSFNQSQP